MAIPWQCPGPWVSWWHCGSRANQAPWHPLASRKATQRTETTPQLSFNQCTQNIPLKTTYPKLCEAARKKKEPMLSFQQLMRTNKQTKMNTGHVHGSGRDCHQAMNQASLWRELGLKLGINLTSIDYGSAHLLHRDQAALAQEVNKNNDNQKQTHLVHSGSCA